MRLFLASISISCAAFMVCADLGATKENQIYLNNDDKNTPHHVSQLVVAKRHNAGDRADAESRKHHVHKISFDDGSSPQVGSSFLTAAAAATKKNDILKKDDGISRQLEQNDDDDGILLSSTDQEDHEIVGGNVVVPFEYPFMVYAVLTENSFCGATLVGQNCLLTAAHCEVVFSNNQVMIGKHDRTDNTEDFEVFDVEMPLHPHPNYDEVTTDYDFMIVKLNASSSFEPVELDDGTKDFAKNATVMGWGHTAWGGPSSNLLRSVDVDVYTEAECKENYPSVTDRMFCAGADGKDSCQNDSGGPIIDSVTQKQIGVVSWGYECAEKGGVYAKVRDQIDWIKSSIDDFCGTEPSQAPTQTPIPTQTPTKNPTQTPTQNPTQNPTQAPTCKNKPLGKACGDPHFRTFNNQFFSYHGQCDLVLCRSEGFANGLGLDIHIRTTRVNSPYMQYSYISGAAVKIGSDILEISEDGKLAMNGKFVSLDENLAHGFFGMFNFTKSVMGSKKKILVYDLELPSEESIQIRANLKSRMLFVDVNGVFPGSEGLLGAPPEDGKPLLARDGMTDLTGHWNTYGEEWQVNDKDPQLFLDSKRFPQYPNGCLYNEQVQMHDHVRRRRRRRLMETNTVSIEVATNACSYLKEDTMKQFCINDIMATGDLDLIEDPFYSN